MSPGVVAGWRVLVGQLAMLVALAMSSVVVYAVALSPSFQPGWLAVDLGIVALSLGVVRWQADAVGFRCLGAHRHRTLVVIAVGSLLVVLAAQIAMPHVHELTIDENNYLAAVRHHGIDHDGLMPYNMRWLVPHVAGQWNVLPVDDAEAVKAINFASFVLTCFYLVLLLVRMRVPVRLAATAPLFLLSSYLGVYGASNRLVIDPLNYAVYALLFHALIRREHWRWFAVILVVGALNSEKVVAWVPILPLTALFRSPTPWRWRDVGGALWSGLRYCGPAVVYVIAIHLYLRSSKLEFNSCVENLNFLSFSQLGFDNPNVQVVTSNFRSLWFPFGAFTMFALLGFARAERGLKPVVLLVGAIFLQTLISCDTRRIIAYAFIVFLPFGFLYLTAFLRDVPKRLAGFLIGTLALAVVAQNYLIAVIARLAGVLGFQLRVSVNVIKLVPSAIEVTVVIAMVFLHFTFYAPESAKPGQIPDL